MVVRPGAVQPSDVVLAHLTGRRTDLKGLIFQGALLLSLLLSLLFLIVLLVDIFVSSMAVFESRSVESFLEGSLSGFPDRAGVSQALYGSGMLMLFVVFISFPLGVAAAVYLEEYASDTRFNRFITVNIRNLAGVPSIVYGLLGLSIFVGTLSAITGGPSLLAGGLTLAILVLPIVIITSSEALRAVPQSIREAGYGVGATKWEVIRSHVLPSAAPGILTGTILAISRAIGEAAPLLLVGAVGGLLGQAQGGFLSQLQDRFTALPIVIFEWTKEANSEFKDLASAGIVVLMVIILISNAAAILLRNRYERKW
ncbi:MAG TPA: phosphate ABC transporter permease PstA [Actinomycetota bacterium]|nr:phosphate ABC transporter permease PstA [Actinomycetota bacterium]